MLRVSPSHSKSSQFIIIHHIWFLASSTLFYLLFLFELFVLSFPYFVFPCLSFFPLPFLPFCSYVFLLSAWEWRIPKSPWLSILKWSSDLDRKCRPLWGNIHIDDKCWENEALYPVMKSTPAETMISKGIRWVRRASGEKGHNCGTEKTSKWCIWLKA